MNDTSVIAVSPSTASRVIGIATIAISSGTSARADANTNASTPSAPTPAIKVSLRNDVEPPSSSGACSSTARPVSITSALPTAERSVAPCAASIICESISAGPGSESFSTFGCTTAYVVRPSSETNASSPVEPYEAVRAPGSASESRPSSSRRSERTAGSSALTPPGSSTTATRGSTIPPDEKRCSISWLVANASLEGMLNWSSSCWVTREAPNMPAIVSTIQNAATERLWARTKSVSFLMVSPSGWVDGSLLRIGRRARFVVGRGSDLPSSLRRTLRPLSG